MSSPFNSVCAVKPTGANAFGAWIDALLGKLSKWPWLSLLQHPASHALPTSTTPRQGELVYGVCIGTAQIGASLAVPIDLLFKRSSLRSSCDLTFATCQDMMSAPTWRVSTRPRYATIPVLRCVCAVPVFLYKKKNTLQKMSAPVRERPCLLSCRSALLYWTAYYTPPPRQVDIVCRAPQQRPYPPLPCLLLVYPVLLVSSVHVWSRSISLQCVGLWSAVKKL